MEKGVVVFRYIQVMTVDKKRILKRMNTSSDTLIEHVVKVVLYRNYRPDDVNGWKKTCARILEKTSTYNSRTIRLTRRDYYYNQFGAFPSDKTDAKGVLWDVYDDLTRVVYPELDYDSIPENALTLYTVCSYLVDKCLDVYTSKDKDKGYDFYRSIVDKAFEQVGM